MSIPYRKPPVAASQAAIAYLSVQRARDGAYIGAMLVTDLQGRPIEFLHNRVEAPRGFLWPAEQVRAAGVTALCHSLFDASARQPALLLAEDELGSVEFCRESLGALVPFALIHTDDWIWVGRPPAPGAEAHGLAEALRARSDPLEPFTRIRAGLREVYPDGKSGPLHADTS